MHFIVIILHAYFIFVYIQCLTYWGFKLEATTGLKKAHQDGDEYLVMDDWEKS